MIPGPGFPISDGRREPGRREPGRQAGAATARERKPTRLNRNSDRGRAFTLLELLLSLALVGLLLGALVAAALWLGGRTDPWLGALLGLAAWVGLTGALIDKRPREWEKPSDHVPVVIAPEGAILGFARASLRPVYRDGQFVPRLILPFSLSYDHRANDGAQAARFTSHLRDLLADIREVLL